jgi:hypothetical protein
MPRQIKELHASSGRPQDDDLSKTSVAAVLKETVELCQPSCVPNRDRILDRTKSPNGVGIITSVHEESASSYS